MGGWVGGWVGSVFGVVYTSECVGLVCKCRQMFGQCCILHFQRFHSPSQGPKYNLFSEECLYLLSNVNNMQKV